ncbi:hypothetical protein E5S69_07545 [Cupriavidus necator]|uniref:hypothetical protein n=1 Tax=Cupriavidus necator TaxID=106590 RepID=UPI0014904BA1|nr:hypothetical protein [Cupriavidus necator]NOV23394.1 hypothetical protein [Cupriavidus necator]
MEPAKARSGPEYYVSLDSSLAEQVEKTAAALRKAGFEGRLSRTRLFGRHKMVSVFAGIEHLLPQTKLVLAVYEESPSAYKRRRLKGFVVKGLVPSISPNEVASVDVLEDRRVHSLLKAARKRQ